MRSRTGRVALVDTGFWFALLEPGDEHHKHAQESEEALLGFRSVLCPWPILYETLNTRFMRRETWIHRFDTFLKHPNVIRLDDSTYREAALAKAMVPATERAVPVHKSKGSALSLVDRVIQLVLDDRNKRVDCLFSYNREDFEEICRRHQVMLHADWDVQE